MESIVVEAIRQLPAVLLAAMAFYFFRRAVRSTLENHETSAVPESLLEDLEAVQSKMDSLESDLNRFLDRLDATDGRTSETTEELETIRSQMSNQKMALKEFGRVLSKTSEQTYNEFGSFEERLRRVESALGERGMLNDDNRSAAA